MPTPAPIQGLTSLVVGATTTLTCATTGGTWSTSDSTIATVNATSGVVTAIGVGSVDIIYTVGTASIAVTLSVITNSITNGFNFNKVLNALAGRITWQSTGVTSLSGRYFEDFHPLCNTSILLDMQSDSTITDVNSAAFSTYLSNKTRSVVMEAVNAVYNARQIINSTKLCFFRPDVMLVPQPVQNAGQFVGIKMTIAPGDRAIKWSSVTLFFDSDVTFNLYLYNDMDLPPLFMKQVTASAYQQVIVDLETDAIFNYLTATEKGGIYYFGYYQNDLGTARALYYNIANNRFNGCRLWAYSAPLYTDPQGNRNFQRNNIGANNLTYGMNIELSVYVDATNNIVQNQSLFDEVIGYLMAVKVVKDLIFSYRSNATASSIKGIPELAQLYGQLNGFKADDEIPYVMGLNDILNRAIKTAKKTFQEHQTKFVGTN